MAVTLYEDDHAGGAKAGPYSESRSDLRSVAGDFNDRTSSLTVTDHKATFYEDINFGGAKQSLEPGKYTLAELEAHGIPNDWISSFAT
jgi:Beta/Gamma crystallin